MRAVVDTNVWVSALINPNGDPARLLKALADQHFTVIVSLPLLRELAEVLERPRIARKYGITHTDIQDLLVLLRARAEDVQVKGELRICRDPDDDVVIETAIRGAADVLVTRDEDLKGSSEVITALGEVGVAVLSVRQFLEAL